MMPFQAMRLRAVAGGGGGGVPTFVAVVNNSNTTSPTLTLPWPTGHVSGDLGVAVVQSDNVAPTTPSGWTLLAQVGAGTPGAALSTMLSVYGRIAASASESSAPVGRNGAFLQGRMYVFRGTATSGFVDDVATTSGATSATLSLPSVTTTGPNRLVLLVVADGTDTGGARYSGWSGAGLTAVTERGDAGSTTATGGGHGLATGERALAGPVGASSVNFALTASNYAAATIALKPA